MATGQGVAVIDFGVGAGLNEASISVTGITTISITSKCEAFIMGDDTSVDHSALDHRYFNHLASLTCGTPTAGVGFTIYGTSQQKFTGKFTVRYVWAD